MAYNPTFERAFQEAVQKAVDKRRSAKRAEADRLAKEEAEKAEVARLAKEAEEKDETVIDEEKPLDSIDEGLGNSGPLSSLITPKEQSYQNISENGALLSTYGAFLNGDSAKVNINTGTTPVSEPYSIAYLYNSVANAYLYLTESSAGRALSQLNCIGVNTVMKGFNVAYKTPYLGSSLLAVATALGGGAVWCYYKKHGLNGDPQVGAVDTYTAGGGLGSRIVTLATPQPSSASVVKVVGGGLGNGIVTLATQADGVVSGLRSSVVTSTLDAFTDAATDDGLELATETVTDTAFNFAAGLALLNGFANASDQAHSIHNAAEATEETHNELGHNAAGGDNSNHQGSDDYCDTETTNIIPLAIRSYSEEETTNDSEDSTSDSSEATSERGVVEDSDKDSDSGSDGVDDQGAGDVIAVTGEATSGSTIIDFSGENGDFSLRASDESGNRIELTEVAISQLAILYQYLSDNSASVGAYSNAMGRLIFNSANSINENSFTIINNGITITGRIAVGANNALTLVNTRVSEVMEAAPAALARFDDEVVGALIIANRLGQGAIDTVLRAAEPVADVASLVLSENNINAAGNGAAETVEVLVGAGTSLVRSGATFFDMCWDAYSRNQNNANAPVHNAATTPTTTKSHPSIEANEADVEATTLSVQTPQEGEEVSAPEATSNIQDINIGDEEEAERVRTTGEAKVAAGIEVEEEAFNELHSTSARTAGARIEQADSAEAYNELLNDENTYNSFDVLAWSDSDDDATTDDAPDQEEDGSDAESTNSGIPADNNPFSSLADDVSFASIHSGDNKGFVFFHEDAVTGIGDLYPVDEHFVDDNTLRTSADSGSDDSSNNKACSASHQGEVLVEYEDVYSTAGDKPFVDDSPLKTSPDQEEDGSDAESINSGIPAHNNPFSPLAGPDSDDEPDQEDGDDFSLNIELTPVETQPPRDGDREENVATAESSQTPLLPRPDQGATNGSPPTVNETTPISIVIQQGGDGEGTATSDEGNSIWWNIDTAEGSQPPFSPYPVQGDNNILPTAVVAPLSIVPPEDVSPGYTDCGSCSCTGATKWGGSPYPSDTPHSEAGNYCCSSWGEGW